jgi:salicylate hydroxylase
VGRPSAAKPSIAILGGGIAGLAAAGFLRKAGLRSTVFEQARQLTEVGAGLVVAPNAMRILRRLGAAETFRHEAVRLEIGWEFRRWQDGAVLSSEDLAGACHTLYGEETYTAHRADLLDALRTSVPDDMIQLGRRCVAVALEDGPVLTFDDGNRTRADIVIGADGIHSVVRQAVAKAEPPRWSGLCAYRALVPAQVAPEFARRKAQTLWVGPKRHLVHYPVSRGRYINLVAFAPAGEDVAESWSATATPEELLAEFDGWDSRLTDLVRAAGTPGRWALLDRPSLSRLSRETLTLIGDAAHPMFPFFAQGAAQAMEDAAVLARCIAEDLGDPARALRRYESARLPRTRLLQARSRGRAPVNHLDDGPEQRARDKALTEKDPLVSNGWIYGYDVDAALARTAVEQSTS